MDLLLSAIVGLSVLALGQLFMFESLPLKITSYFSSAFVDKACLHLWRAGAKDQDAILLGRIILATLLCFFAFLLLPSPLCYVPLLVAILAITLYLQQSKQRQEQAKDELIHMSSTLSLAVAGGQDLSVAMTFYCSQEKGLLPEACKDALSRLRLGQNIELIFDDVQKRYPATKEFFSAISLSRRQGTALAHVLKDQAQRWRQKRLLQMEARAQKLPILLLGPLAICIFPNVFLVLMGPYLLELI